MTEWMTVYSTPDSTEAQIVRGRLEVEGIRCIVDFPTASTVFGFTHGQFGLAHVVVDPSDYEAALAILESVPEAPELNDDNQRVILGLDDVPK